MSVSGAPQNLQQAQPSRLTAFLWSCFSSPTNTLLTIVLLIVLGATVPEFIRWSLIDAVWSGTSSKDCANVDAACWLFVKVRIDQILYGPYPAPERWRIYLAAVLGFGGIALIVTPWVKRKAWLATYLLLVYPIIAGILLRGGIFGLTSVPTRNWGGLVLTSVVAVWTIGTSIPLGLALALARRSSLPVVSWVAASFIDLMRGLPLIGVLFLAIVMFPFFVPPGVEVDKLLRALIAFTLLDAALLAEIFRGGLQAVPRGQEEAAAALGLPHWQTMLLVIIPQAVTIALPGIVNVCIVVVKETVVVLLVGLFDFLAILQNGVIDPAWLVGDQIRATAYLFAGLVFWAICFSISRYSSYLERRLGTGRHH
jgi:general L-amino acid transport system permease protein